MRLINRGYSEGCVQKHFILEGGINHMENTNLWDGFV